MMISGGENVLPAEIESVLSLHEAVAEVAVVGLPEDRLGHKITVASGLATFNRRWAYVFKDAIPKSPVGKILRRHLLEPASR